MSGLSIWLALGVIFSWGFWSVLAKFGIDCLGPFKYLFYSQIVASIAVLGYILLLGDYQFGSGYSYKQFIYPIAGGVVSAVAILLLYVLMSREPGSIAIPLTSIYPIVTIFILVVILQAETMGLKQVIGALFAVVGAVLLSL